MAGVEGIGAGEVVELPVTAGDDPVAHPVVDLGVPATGDVGDEAVEVPVGQGEQGGVLDAVLHVAAVHDLVGEHAGDAGADLAVELLVVAGEVQEDLVTHDAGDAADVVVRGLFGLQADVSLLGLAELVVDDELDAAVELVVEQLLDLFQVLVGRAAGEGGQFKTAEVVVGVEVLELHERPEPVVVLDAVLSELHFVAVVELGRGLPRKQEEQEDPEGKGEPKRWYRTHGKTGGKPFR